MKFITTVYFIFLSLNFLHAQKREEKTNVVFILADDLGYMDLGCYGSSFYETPNLDALAKDGMRFTRAYAAAPVCSPTRASILTGKYPLRTGITDYINSNGSNQPENWKRNTLLLPAPNVFNLSLDELTLAEAVKRAGYKTFFAGKWHLGNAGSYPEDHGFEINMGGYTAGQPASYFSPYSNPRLKDGPKGEYLPERLSNETANFIRQNKDVPFFIYHSMYLAHTPLRAKVEIIAKYEKKAKGLNLKEDFGTEGKYKVRLNQTLPVYAAMVEALDDAVGTIINSLKKNGLYEKTLIVFTSDNGGLSTSEGSPTSNVPLRAGKGWLYEGGIREPLLVRLPGVTKAGSVNASLISSPDFYPTILDALRIPLISSQHYDGRSFFPLLKGRTKMSRDLYWHYPQYGNQGGTPSSCIMKGDWKLIRWYERPSDSAYELYNLRDDVTEKHDVSKKFVSKTRKMRLELDAFLKNAAALYPQTNPRYKQE